MCTFISPNIVLLLDYMDPTKTKIHHRNMCQSVFLVGGCLFKHKKNFFRDDSVIDSHIISNVWW